ncbi:hypothetical protein [Halorubrum salinum]|uniref:hypothetical protein n=1 Tax=Halorubrum salinum TaxID=767517 RepID=UPI002112AF93|nr:hypothetical protein [Halorubrum salinum]
MFASRNLSLWAPQVLLGALLLAYGQDYVAIDVLGMVPGLDRSLTIAGYTIGAATLLGLFAIAFAVVVVASESGSDEEGGGEALLSVAAAIRAGAFAGIVGIGVYFYRQTYASPRELVFSLWWVPLLLLVGWFMFVYLQNRRKVASGTTALNRSQRDVRRAIESWSELGTAAIALAVTAVFAAISGFFTGAATLAEPLLEFAGHGVYLLTVVIGYTNLGGEWRYGWVIPELSPLQFVAITLFLGAVAIVVHDR